MEMIPLHTDSKPCFHTFSLSAFHSRFVRLFFFFFFFLHHNCKCLAKQWPQGLTQHRHNYTFCVLVVLCLKSGRQSFREGWQPCLTFKKTSPSVVWHLHSGQRECADLQRLHTIGSPLNWHHDDIRHLILKNFIVPPWSLRSKAAPRTHTLM